MTAIPILLYHSVGAAPSATCRPWYVSVPRFDEHLSLIRSLGFNCMTISALVDAIDRATLPVKPLAITFDDGGADFVENAVPLLARHGLPSTMYVPTSYIGDFMPWSGGDDSVGRSIMDWDTLRRLDPDRVELGAHSMTHPQLDIVSSHRRRSEIHSSKAQLEAGLGRPVRTFAYPHGYHSAKVRQVVREAGFDSASACGKRWSHIDDDRFALSRLTVMHDWSADDLAAVLTAPPRQQPGPRHVARWGWRCARRLRSRFVGGV